MPQLAEVAQWARQEELPVAVLTINVWEAAGRPEDTPDVRLQSVQQFIKDKRLALPVAMDYTDETATAYGVTSIPATFIIRSDGVVHARLHPGAGGLKTAIGEALGALEAPPDGEEG
jgi:hypothetical protein